MTVLKITARRPPAKATARAVDKGLANGLAKLDYTHCRSSIEAPPFSVRSPRTSTILEDQSDFIEHPDP